MKFIDSSRDPWVAHDLAAQQAAQAPAYALLALQDWLGLEPSQRQQLSRGSRVGLVLPNDFEVEALEAELPALALLALQFPKWTDGRAYTQARLLRLRYRFAGELRATGQGLVDMLLPLARSGFDSAQLREDQDPLAARRALEFFPGHYQADARQPLQRPAGLGWFALAEAA